jgi:hypothetical protein
MNLNKSLNTEVSENILNEEAKIEVLSTAKDDLNKHKNFNLEKQNSTKSRHLKRRMIKLHSQGNEYIEENNKTIEKVKSSTQLKTDPNRSKENIEVSKELNKKHKRRIKLLEEELGLDNESEEIDNHGMEEITDSIQIRRRRSQRPIKPEILDQGIRHGGNSVKNLTDVYSSVSSFENGLLHCYGGNVLLTHEFDPSDECVNVNYLLNGNKHVQTIHEVAEDGYYYYIFYSDNDIVSNDIHAVFEIYKPTLQYENVTKACINQTECTFPLSLASFERVIVEVPTKDGIDHEIDDISVLVSTCVPRMGIYAIFPIAVLFLILGCAFM